MNELAAALKYAEHGMLVCPVRANKTPLTLRGSKDATTNPAQITAWWRQWPHCDWAWALPASVVVVDIDVKGGRNGYADFERLAGCDPRDVDAPAATTPSGGLQLFYAAAKPYRNCVAINGTGLDTRTKGGYVLLPLDDNGREYLRPLLGATLPPAPPWLDVALRREETRSPAEDPDLPPSGYDEKFAREALARACTRIGFAPRGSQDATRNAECFFIGLLVGRGALDRDVALAALKRAALAMPTYGKPWRNLEERTEKSLEAGVRHAEVAP
jgi:hypothetical protein